MYFQNEMYFCFDAVLFLFLYWLILKIRLRKMKTSLGTLSGIVLDSKIYEENNIKQTLVAFEGQSNINRIIIDGFYKEKNSTIQIFYKAKKQKIYLIEDLIARKNKAFRGFISAIIIFIGLLLFELLMQPFKFNSLFSIISFAAICGIVVFLVYSLIFPLFLGLHKTYKINIIDNNILSLPSHEDNNEGSWKCMGCGRINFNSVKECCCGYKHIK